ncbi:hypothetical protein BGX29_000605 [Mortierella sp. GBA35]|nr:hypothetical protein BGX29_000605 [Mortierella sp. GBA35]
MASQEVAYLILEYISIALFLFLLGHCIYRSINYTLQIFCVVAILNNINESILLLHYEDRVMARTYGTVGCTISAIFEQLIPLILNSLAACMGFNIWYLIVVRTVRTERQMLKWYCLFSFGMPLIATSVAVILLRNEPFYSAYPRRYYCDLGGVRVTHGTFAYPMLVTCILGILCALCTVVFLVRHYFLVRRTLNNGTTSTGSMVFELSYCVRLLIFCIGFGLIVLMAVLGSMVDSKQNATYDSGQHLSVSSDFSGSLIGIVIFVIFGTTRDAFRTLKKLVCCGRDWKDVVHCREQSESMNPMTSSSGGSSGVNGGGGDSGSGQRTAPEDGQLVTFEQVIMGVSSNNNSNASNRGNKSNTSERGEYDLERGLPIASISPGQAPLATSTSYVEPSPPPQTYIPRR